jgi:hypothetical protein
MDLTRLISSALLLSACAGRPHDYPTCAEGAEARPVAGRMEIDYAGWAGRAPRDEIPFTVDVEIAEAVHFTGCGYDRNDDYWWIELGLLVPSTAPRPSSFGNTGPETPSANAFIMHCADGDCVEKRRRTWFDPGGTEVSGTLHEFDAAMGRLDADLDMKNVSTDSLETGTFSVHADISWQPRYRPTVTRPLDGRWKIRTTKRLSGSTDFDRRIELAQSGNRLTARLCAEDWTCTDPGVTGRLADPDVYLSWHDANQNAFDLGATFSDGGARFTGNVIAGSIGWWQIEAEPVP